MQESPEQASDSDSDDSGQLSSVIDERTFHGIPETDWRSVTQDEVRAMSIPELHGLHIDDDQRYLVVRMLASSKPATLTDMHEILSEANPKLDYSTRQHKVNALRLDDTVRLLTQRLAGEYLFEVRSRV